jgi:hypothetical protein
MAHEDRNLGVAEARIGLSIITCLLLVLGYVVLQRLGGTGQRPPVEIHSGQSAELPELPSPTESGDADQPHVLTPEVCGPAEPPIQTTRRPPWLVTPHDDAGQSPPGVLDPLDLPKPTGQLGGLPDDQLETWRASRGPDPEAVR